MCVCVLYNPDGVVVDNKKKKKKTTGVSKVSKLHGEVKHCDDYKCCTWRYKKRNRWKYEGKEPKRCEEGKKKKEDFCIDLC